MPKSIIDMEFPDTSEEKDVSFELTDDVRDFTPEQEYHDVPQQFDTDPAVTLDYNNRHSYCPRCGKPLFPAINLNDYESPSWLECRECPTLINTFEATDYQAVYLSRPERYKMGAGGFGTGKSRMNIEDVQKHLCLIKNARVAVAAKTYPILDGTFKKEFYQMFPKRLLRDKNESKRELSLTNGSELLFRSFDDPIKFKSMNLTMALMVEASDVKYDNFVMLQSRIRNTAAMIPYYDENMNPVKVWNETRRQWVVQYRVDARHMSLETNPDSGWVKRDFLLDSATVDYFGEAKNEGYRFREKPDKEKYIQIVSTSANPHLPPNYEEEQTHGKSKAYIMQYFKGSFNFSSNLVLPNFGNCIVQPHPLPREFNEYRERVLYYLIGMDYGINDPTHIVFGAYSLETKKVYLFAEMRINNSNVRTIAKEYRREFRQNGIDPNGLLMLPRFDGRSYNRRESDLETIGEQFEAEGLYFEPDFSYNESRIMKMNSLVNNEQLEVFSNLEFFIDEALNYKFAFNKTTRKYTNKPEDGNDHGITAAMFIVVNLPANLQHLKLASYLPAGTEIRHDTKYREEVRQKKHVGYDPFQKEERKDGTHFVGGRFSGTGVTARHFSVGSSMVDPYAPEDEEDRDDNYDSRSTTLRAHVPGR